MFYAHITQLGYRFGYLAENTFAFVVKDDEVFRKCFQAIDRNGKITRSRYEPKIYRSKYMSWYDYDDSSYFNMHEKILLAYCGCYGVDSSDVELLLEYGYTCDEIEDMLTDHSLLREALKDVKYICGEEVYESYCGAF